MGDDQMSASQLRQRYGASSLSLDLRGRSRPLGMGRSDCRVAAALLTCISAADTVRKQALRAGPVCPASVALPLACVVSVQVVQ